MHSSQALRVLQDRVQARAQALMSEHPDWPCRRGCDACCRRLARVPELTEAEWETLAGVLHALPAAEQAACLERADQLAAHVRVHGEEQPVECPLLDPEQGTCRVYLGRPLACRSYGFYASRSHDAWCNQVTEHVTEVRDQLIFGNQDALERDLSQLGGATRDLLSWLESLR